MVNRKKLGIVGAKVLLVDDSDVTLHVIKSYLTHHGYSVITASSGKLAIELAGKESPDCIVLDLMMPDMQGDEVTRRLKADKELQYIPVIMLTAKSDRETIINCLNSGANDFITKGYDPRVLLERVNGQVRMGKLQKELQKINAVKDRFLRMASHDIRNSISCIKLLTGSVIDGLEGPVSEDQMDVMNRIQHQTNTMLNLLNDILDVSVITSGELKIKPKPHSIADVLKEAFEGFVPAAKAKSITLNWAVPDNISPVTFDYNRIMEVTANLLSNAVKYCKPGEQVELGAKAMEEEVQVWVKDNGQGIKEEELPSLFNSFERLSSKPTGHEKSTGLGLSIAKQIMDLHKGKIWAHSEYGEGATFIFSLSI
ncbi:MAG: hybrid sensor histidine kinase/response regulator [Fibrobacteria bacterium]|nr:hybrid sensor histidine kinase/response regulator [Fibrobacteria bacterium]